jgi:hypothetical protein
MPISDEERASLVLELASVVHRHGKERLLEGTLVEPTSAYFGEAMDGSDDALVRLGGDVFGYAGLPTVRLGVDPVRLPRERSGGGGSAVVVPWGPVEVLRVVASQCSLLASSDLADLPGVVASLCRAAALVFDDGAARASPYRSEGWRLPETDAERRRVDVMTVYLGLGLLTTNDSYRFLLIHKSNGRKDHVHRRAGFLGEEAMSFLLALQVRARGLGRREAQRLATLLETNQADYFRDAWDEIDDAECAALLEGG